MTRRKTQEFLKTLLGLEISIGTIHHMLQEAARSCEPLEAVIIQEIEQAALVYADETPWKESKKFLWLWAVQSQFAALFVIGARTKGMFERISGSAFKGILMSDGYLAYRSLPNRLRCWAHLKRKLKALSESTHPQVAQVGALMAKLFKEMMDDGVYAAREKPAQQGPPESKSVQALLHFYGYAKRIRPQSMMR